MRAFLSGLSVLTFGSLLFAACVGDEPSTPPDQTGDGGAGDGNAATDGGGDSANDGTVIGDGGDDARVAPTPVGTFGWKNIYPTQNPLTQIAYDNAGNLFVAINYSATFSADGSHSFNFAGGSDDIALVKLSPTGIILWATNYSTASDEFANGITSDGTDVYLAGQFASATLDFGNGKVATNVQGSENEAFLVKLRGSDGQAQWVDNFATASATAANSACEAVAFGDGRLALLLQSGRSVQFPLTTGATQTLPVQDTTGGTAQNFDDDYFVASIDPATGKAFWALAAGGDNATTADSIAIANDGSIAVYVQTFATTVSDSTATLNYTNPRGSSHRSVFVYKLGAADGHTAWKTNFNDSAATNVAETQAATSGLAFNSKGEVLVSGQVTGSVPIGDKTVVAHGATMTDAFLAELDGTNGSTNFAFAFGGGSAEGPASLAVDPFDNIFLVGSYLSSDFAVGAKSLPSPAPGQGTYLLKLDPSANLFWAYGTVGFADASNTSLDLGGNVAVDPSSDGVSWVGMTQNGAEVDFGDGKPVSFTTGTVYVVHRAP